MYVRGEEPEEMRRTISLILGVPLREGSLLDGLLGGAEVTMNG